MNNSNPIVSLIVPVYNGEDYIGKTVQSVLKQTYDNWELLIIDDGSTDHTKEVINKFKDHPRIKYFYKKNGGQGSARNLGIKKSKGSYLAFLDADDLWDEDRLEMQIKLLLEKDVSLVFSPMRCIDKSGKYLNKSLGNGKGMFQGFQALFLMAAGTISIPNSSVIASKESVVRAGCFNESEEIRNMEDYDLWFRMLMSGSKFYGTEKILGSYRIHQDQNTYSDPGQNLKMINYLEKMSREYPEKKEYFKFLILQRLSAFHKQQDNTSDPSPKCRRIYFSNSCLNSYWFEKYLMNAINLNNYLRLRGLLIRKFRRYKTFVQRINN